MSNPVCKACSKPIRGRYINAIDATWHPEHFCCAICQRPMGDTPFYTQNGYPCHAACYADKIAPRCVYCTKPLMERHQINYWGERFCIEHSDQMPSCIFCNRLVPHLTKRTRRRSTELISCDLCASTAILSAPQAKHLLPQLMGWLEQIGLKFRKKTFRLEVLERAEFLARDGRRDPLGLTSIVRHYRNKRLDRVEVKSIALLKGLPHALFEGVCVHELGHVWLAQHKVANLPAIDEEGFCELLSYRHYMRIGSKVDLFHAERVAESTDPIYGGGFRKLHQLKARVGFAQIVQSLQRKKRLPL